MPTIAASVISACAAIVVCIISSSTQNKKIISEIDKHNELQGYKIEQLTLRVEQHNKVLERVYKLERFDEVEKEQIKVINHRINDLENYCK